jgi:tRNA nucleotidyltransferase (CCA-adding enzyme)
MRAGQRLELLESNPTFAIAERIVRELQKAGYLTVLAGGCVRDSLLGVKPKDLDIATGATPEVVEELFSKTLAVGKDFGTIVVVEDGHNFEVTTFRREGPYEDGRHPSSVTFTDAAEDARRRDFTVNALFYDPLEREVIDFVGGLDDLHKKILRAVGNPSERFREDRLRMLRAIRFVAQLGFELESSAMQAIQEQAEELKVISAERILNEVKRFLSAEHLWMGMKALLESGLERRFWPELSSFDVAKLKDHPRFLSWENTFAAISLMVPFEDVETRLRSWKSSKDSLRSVEAQRKGLRVLMNQNSSRADRARVLGGEVFAEVLLLAEIFMSADQLEKIVQEFLQVSTEGELPKPFVTGEDLVGLGVAPGAQMGALLKETYDQQLEGRLTSKSAALEQIKQKIKA